MWFIMKSYHNEFVSVNNIFREYNEMKEEIKKNWKCCGIYDIKTMKSWCLSCKKNSESSSVKKTKNNKLIFLSICAACGK